MKIARVWMALIAAGLAVGATFMAMPGSVAAWGRSAAAGNDDDHSVKACASVEGGAKAHGKGNGHAHANGQTRRLERLAAELGISVEELVELQSEFDVSLQEIMTAHMIDERATTDISLDQILTMRAEGKSWHRIAAEAGLDVNFRAQGRGHVDVDDDDCDADVSHGAKAHGKANAQARLAGRLAAELGISAEELLEQQRTFGVSLKELAIAHRIVARSTTDITIEDVFAMRASGADWRQIAAAAGVSAGEIKAATKANGHGGSKVKSSVICALDKNVRRAAAEVGISAEEFLQQQQAFGASTAELVLAHRIVANAATGLTVGDVFAMRAQGATWTEIMSTAGVSVRDLVNAKASTRTTAQSEATTRTNADVQARGTTQAKAKGIMAAIQNRIRASATARAQSDFNNDMNGSATAQARNGFVNGNRVNARIVAGTRNGTGTSSAVANGAGAGGGIKNGQQARPMRVGMGAVTKARIQGALRAQGGTNGTRLRHVTTGGRTSNTLRGGGAIRVNATTALRSPSSVRLNSVTGVSGATRVSGVTNVSGATRVGGLGGVNAIRGVSGVSGVSGGLRANLGLTGRLGLTR